MGAFNSQPHTQMKLDFIACVRRPLQHTRIAKYAAKVALSIFDFLTHQLRKRQHYIRGKALLLGGGEVLCVVMTCVMYH